MDMFSAIPILTLFFCPVKLSTSILLSGKILIPKFLACVSVIQFNPAPVSKTKSEA